MSLKHCFTLMGALIILLSITAVAACENSTDDIALQEESPVSLGSADDNVDLSVDIDVKSSYVDGKYNSIGSEVPWTITVTAKGGTARNAQVREVLSPNLGYVSSNASVGEYNSKTGIWKIGDLVSSSTASLTIITKLNREGTYLNKAYAITDSSDTNLLDNFKFLSIKTGSSKSTSNITETTDDRNAPDHNIHYQSMIKSRLSEESDLEENKKHDGGSDDGHNQNFNPNHQDNNGHEKHSVAKSVSFIDAIFNEGEDSNDDTSNSYKSSSNMHFNAIHPYDFTTIPILIFALFLIMSLAIWGYDKLK